MKQLSLATIGLFTILLCACSIGGMAGPFPGGRESSSTSNNSQQSLPLGPPAAPQVVYRIDENRFFEFVPYEALACRRAYLYYTDKKQGIHTLITSTRKLSASSAGEEDFIIDAANTNYLVAPIINPEGDCGSDSADRMVCSTRMPYSTDSGKTWKYAAPQWIDSSSPTVLTGEQVFYADSVAHIPDLHQGSPAWKETKKAFPQPRKAPIDTKFHCNRDEEE